MKCQFQTFNGYMTVEGMFALWILTLTVNKRWGYVCMGAGGARGGLASGLNSCEEIYNARLHPMTEWKKKGDIGCKSSWLHVLKALCNKILNFHSFFISIKILPPAVGETATSAVPAWNTTSPSQDHKQRLQRLLWEKLRLALIKGTLFHTAGRPGECVSKHLYTPHFPHTGVSRAHERHCHISPHAPSLACDIWESRWL